MRKLILMAILAAAAWAQQNAPSQVKKLTKAEFDSLHPDQIVTVTLVKKKETPKPKKDADKDPLEGENKPVASMVVIQVEPPPMK